MAIPTTDAHANRQLARDFVGLPMRLRRAVLEEAALLDGDAAPWADHREAHTATVDAFALAARTGRLGLLREIVDAVRPG